MAPPQLSSNDFKIVKQIGKGGSGVVVEAIWWTQRCHVAIKKIKKIHYDTKKYVDVENQARREIEIHSRLRHQSIVRLHGSFEDKDFFYLVLELCKNGSLEEYLRKNKPLAESEVSSLLKPVIHGIKFMHDKNFMHHDLTLKNLLLTDDRKGCKIVDFGLARYVPEGDKSCTIAGTPNYMAPETIIGAPHDKAVDCWGLGIILYTLLIGEPPFDKKGRKTPEILSNIIQSDIEHKGLLNILSENAKNLIMSLLKKNMEERIKIEDVLNHPFFNEKTVPFKNLTNYSQKTIDSGLGSSGSSSFATNSKLGRSKHPSSIARKNLETIASYSYDSNIEDSGSESYNEIFSNKDVNPHIVQSRNYKQYEGSSVKQLKNKIQPLPSKQYYLRSDIPEQTSTHGRTNSIEHSDRQDYIRKRATSKNRQKTDYRRSRSESPVMQPDKNNGYSYSTVEENYVNNCANSSNYKVYNEANNWNQKGRPVNHNPTQQCIDNHHRGNSRSPTRSPICTQANIPSPHASDRQSYKHGYDEFPQYEQTPCAHCEHQLSIANRVNSHKENPTHHIPVHSCGHDRYHTIEINAYSHSNHKHGDYVIPKAAPSVAELEKPLNTIRLKARRFQKENSVISILKSGDVCIEILKDKKYVTTVYRISMDGLELTMYKPSFKCVVKDEPPPIPKRGIVRYSYEDLPERKKMIYKYAANFVSCVQAKTAKITFYAARAKGVMMENSPPDYELLFYDGGKIIKSGKRITLTTKYRRTYDIIYKEKEIKGSWLVDEAEEVIESVPIALDNEAKDMWIYFQKIYKLCLKETIVKEMNSLYLGDTLETVFPIVWGKKPEIFSQLQDCNKENNTPQSMRSSSLNVMSFNGSVDTHYSPSEYQSQKYVNIRPNSQASVKSNRPSSALSSIKHKTKMKGIKPNVNISNDDEGNFCAKFEDGIELKCTKRLTEIDIYDKKNDICYDNVDKSTYLPPHCEEKLHYVRNILCNLENKRNRKIS